MNKLRILSVNREHQRCSVTDKAIFLSRREAKAYLKRRQRPDVKLFVYLCQHCGYWHLTRSRTWNRADLNDPSVPQIRP